MIWLLLSVAHAAEPAAQGGSAASLLAPVVAIVFALATRRVLPSLAAGVCVAALVAAGGAPLDAISRAGSYLFGVVVDVEKGTLHRDHLMITTFSLFVAGTVGVMGQTGGTRALVGLVEGLARGRSGAMVASWLAGALVFFDDYANCLVVGGSMGPLCDRFKVSRAKLAYIVDSTAAPVASLAVVSTWVGYEVGLIDSALQNAGSDLDGFGIFVEALPYRFYSLFTIVFVGAIAITGRDFGPMLQAEQTASEREDEGVSEAPLENWRALLAAVPVGILVAGTLGLMISTGRAELGAAVDGAALFEILGKADAYGSMLAGSFMAFVLAVGMGVLVGKTPLSDIWGGIKEGIHPVGEALLVLFLAWTLSDGIADTHAAAYLEGLLSSRLPAVLLPSATFLLAAATAFATGTSFGTMGILIPLVVPLALGIAPDQHHILLNSTAAILAGACLGDHASPISDTTVLSALGAGCEVVEHVRTQLPYALTAGVIALLCGHLPAALGLSPWLCLPLGAAVSIGVVRGLGTVVGAETTAATA